MSHTQKTIILSIVVFLVTVGLTVGVLSLLPRPTEQDNTQNDSTSQTEQDQTEDPLQPLIDEAEEAASNGTAQEAVDAYTALAEAAEEVGDVDRQATALDNARTYQSIVEGERYNESLNETPAVEPTPASLE